MRTDAEPSKSDGPISIPPDDEFNRRLVARVHPYDWVNPTESGRYNLVVIGAGAAGLGAKFALIEKHLLGGDCLNVDCDPSKALIRAARAASHIRFTRSTGQFWTITQKGS
ncbi:MAG: hypothetical protein WEB58_21585 [Planctomycetaceae bacterium]